MTTPSTKLAKLEKKLLHYTGKAIADFNMIQKGDRVMLCLSGGKDSFTLLYLLNQLRKRSNNKFELLPSIRASRVGMIPVYENGWRVRKSPTRSTNKTLIRW